jgi:hypothetical protein
LHFIVVAVASWMNRQQQVIECLRTENQILPEKPGAIAVKNMDARRRVTLLRQRLESAVHVLT